MRVEFDIDRQLFPFESRFFESSAGRIHYIDEGSGTPILFLHGNPTWSFLYRNIVKDLRARFRCVAVDYPGFGLSDRPEGYGYTAEEHATVVGELVDELDLQGFIVMGQDWGGPIGMRVATRRAERVSGVILGNTWFWPFSAYQVKTFSKVMSSSFMQRQIIQRNFFVERIIPFATRRRYTDAEMDHYRGVLPSPESRLGVAEFPKQLLAASPMLAEIARDVPALLGDRRALIVWGTKDPAFPPKRGLPKVAATFPDHDIVELPGAKHYIQEDAPKEIAAAISERFG